MDFEAAGCCRFSPTRGTTGLVQQAPQRVETEESVGRSRSGLQCDRDRDFVDVGAVLGGRFEDFQRALLFKIDLEIDRR